MIYKNYESIVEFDDDAGFFHGEVIGIRDVITFQGVSDEDLRTSFHQSVEDYLEFCKTKNKSR
ncbi:MAG: type II toxin-antitoxin system HicB family antitoxin [Bacteroidetes bacterium]|nr:type II toxin-antitoxin system HicB family antitoxin [Bacteroidota bacterium]